jgi:hypothetical protein
MRARILLIVLNVIGLAALSMAQDTETAANTGSLDTLLCITAVQGPKIATAVDGEAAPSIKQALKIQVGSSTHVDVARLLGEPWRVSNDADCEATQYSEIWQYLAEDENGAYRIHVAFSKEGKASLVARIPRRGRAVVLAFTPDHSQEHRH